MAKRSFSSIAIGTISSTSRHVRRAEVELRTVVGEERRVAATLFLRQDVGLGLELRVRLHRTRLAENLTALHAVTVDTADQRADIVAGLALVEQLAELTTPRSTRPVTTVPRPEIENTSSIGIRKGWSIGRSGVGM